MDQIVLTPEEAQRTNHELLLEVRKDVKDINVSMSILLSQDLDRRIRSVEKFQWTLVGASTTVSLIALGVSVFALLSGL